MSAHLYIEGGESKEDQIRCREGFRKLLEKSGFSGRLPRLTASGGRGSAFSDFSTAHRSAKNNHYVAMLIDSEDPVADLDKDLGASAEPGPMGPTGRRGGRAGAFHDDLHGNLDRGRP